MLDDVGLAGTLGADALSDRLETGEAILEELYDQYARALYRYALSLLGSADDAEDAVQEVFIRIARESGLLRRVSDVKSYLYTGVRNSAYSILRKRRHRNNIEQAVCADLLSRSEVRAADPDLGLALCKAFAELPVEQREVLVLKAYDGLTFREISKTTGSPVSTVTSRYRYALDRLRKALEEGEDGR